MSKILDFIRSTGEGLLSSVKGILDEVVTTKEERDALAIRMQEEMNRHLEELYRLSVEELRVLEEARVKDLASARESNTLIQQSENASWLAKNTAYGLDIFIGLIWGITTLFIFAKLFNLEIASKVNIDMVNVLAIYTTVSNIFMIIVGFHRGSSVGQQENKIRRYEIK